MSWQCPNLMLVEGGDDQAFAAKHIELVPNHGEWQVHKLGNNNSPQWAKVLDVILVDPWFAVYGKSISFVQDGDLDAGVTFNRLASVFKKFNLPIPVSHGEVISNARWKTGVFIMPDGKKSGTLENLLLDSISNRDRRNLAAQYVTDAEKAFGQPEYPSKSQLQSYLAVHKDFVKWIEVAIEKDSIFPSSDSIFDPFRDFVKNLAS